MVKKLKICALSLSLFILLITTLLWLLCNIHTVIPNQLYRSAQLSNFTMKQLISFEKIKTIVNLRGSNPQEKWYQNETRYARQLGITHYDIRLSSREKPKAQQLRQLVSILISGPKPMWIHCESGADRTGMVAAFALILNNNTNVEEIKKQFSWHYGVFSKESIGKKVLPFYFSWLAKNNLPNNRENLIRWANLKYPWGEGVI